MSGYLNTPDSDWYKARLAVTVFIVIAAFCVLFVRLFYLQVIEGKEYRRLSENQCIRLQDVDAPRGLILDRNGKLLVDNRPSFNISIVPKDAGNVGPVLKKLAHYAGFDQKELEKIYQKKKGSFSYKPVLLKQDIKRDTLAAIEVHSYDLPGIIVNVKPTRQYIYHESAAHVLGYLSEIDSKELNSGKYPGAKSGDFIGKYGLEKVYEHYLRGENGGRQVEVDATGQVIRVLTTIDAVPGNNVYITIDMELQRVAEEALKDKVGAVVAVDPATGEVLAMASSPTFDPNQFVSSMSVSNWNKIISNPFRPMENKAIQAEYPPASTYKIITAIAALEEGIIDFDTEVNCPGYYHYGNRTYRCWKRYGHGKMGLLSSIAESCDVFFYQAGQKTGVDRLAHYAMKCGLGRKTGLKLPHEENGLVPSIQWKKEKLGKMWHGGETLSVAIGQGANLTTPLQLAMLYAAVGDGGTLKRPRLMKRIETAEGETVLETKPEITGELPVKPDTLEAIRQGLVQVVDAPRGTARGIRMETIPIAGKTGTAQVIGRKDGEEKTDEVIEKHHLPHAWFIGYAPVMNPKITVSVIVEHGEHGSSAAAPIVQALVKEYLKPGEKTDYVR